MTDRIPHRTALAGALASLLLGAGIGAGLKAEVSPQSSYGQQLMLGERQARAPDAFDSWYPPEGAPVPAPWMEVADLRAADTDGLDAAIERLFAWRPEEPAPAPRQPDLDAGTDGAEAAILPRRPIPYLALAAAESPPRPPPAPAEPPAWGWALPGNVSPPPGPDAFAPPPYPGAAAG